MDQFEEASLEEVNQLLVGHPLAAGEDGPVQIEVAPIDEARAQTPAVSGVSGVEPEPAGLLDQSERHNATSPRLPDPTTGEPGTKEAPEVKDLTVDNVSETKSLPLMDTVSLSDGEDEAKIEALASNPCPDEKHAEEHNSDYLLERIRELKEERDKVTELTDCY